MPSMRQMKIFSGSSHPNLADAVCERLGQDLAKADLGKFANGETKVQLSMSSGSCEVLNSQAEADSSDKTLPSAIRMSSLSKAAVTCRLINVLHCERFANSTGSTTMSWNS